MTKREKVLEFFKDMLRQRTLQEIIEVELREAYLSKLQAEKELEYATSIVEFNQQRISRLHARLGDLRRTQ